MDALEMTTDPVEREILLSERIEPLDIDCEHSVQTRILLRDLAAMQSRIKPPHLRWARLFVAGRSYREIAEIADVQYRTVYDRLKKPKMVEYMSKLARVRHLESGPTVSQRVGMLWRIAKREEIDNPRVSIAAVDVINKQKGDYAPQDEAVGGLTVNINQFNVTSPGGAAERAVHDAKPPVIEGEFTPISVETPE